MHSRVRPSLVFTGRFEFVCTSCPCERLTSVSVGVLDNAGSCVACQMRDIPHWRLAPRPNLIRNRPAVARSLGGDEEFLLPWRSKNNPADPSILKIAIPRHTRERSFPCCRDVFFFSSSSSLFFGLLFLPRGSRLDSWGSANNLTTYFCSCFYAVSSVALLPPAPPTLQIIFPCLMLYSFILLHILPSFRWQICEYDFAGLNYYFDIMFSNVMYPSTKRSVFMQHL